MYEYKIKEVLKVVDGDTIDVIADLGFNVTIKLRLRLYGVNTPETRTRNKKEKARGLKAKQFTIDYLNDDGGLYFKSEKRGKYGRWLATVFRVPKKIRPHATILTLNDALVKNRLAVRYYGGKR